MSQGKDIKLSIIIPYHNEDDLIIEPLFTSIKKQKEININRIEIIVINNCKNPIKPRILSDGSLGEIQNRIRYIISPIKGYSGQSRQCGIEESHGEFVMFCDADDALWDDFSLKNMLCEAEKDDSADEYVFAEMMEAIDENNNMHIIPVDPTLNILIFIHGKLYRKEFLMKNDIKFSALLDTCEDNYFNMLMNIFNPIVKVCNSTVYLWKYNCKSVSRKNTFEFQQKCATNYLYATCDSLFYAEGTLNNVPIDKVHHHLYLMYQHYLDHYNMEWYQPNVELIASMVRVIIDNLTTKKEYLQYIGQFTDDGFKDFVNIILSDI